MIEVGVLGSIVVRVDDHPVDLTGVLEKGLLARLSLTPGREVSQSVLIDDLWGELPPSNAVGSLQTLVYRLRKALGTAGSLVTRTDNGYSLEIPPERVDASRFNLLVERARRARLAPAPNDRALLAEALSLWRGPALAGLDKVPFVVAWRAGLEAARMSALEGRITADLAAGAGGELVAELEILVTEHPFNESLWGHLIVALYRNGSQAAALRCYERVRALLSEELGLTPSPALVALESAVLRQDPSLVVVDQEVPASGSKGTGSTPAWMPEVATVVATDLEARGRLWTDDPKSMADAIRRLDALLVGAVATHRGRLLSTTDGGSSSVFHQPSDALAAAFEFQLSVMAESWGGIETLPVTVAVHTGEVEMDDGNVFGPVLHVASRLTQTAYGGQIVVTATTAELTREGLPPGCELLDLGHWSLRDVARPVHAYELRHRELGNPMRALRAPRPGTGTLPVHSTSFVGRDAELSELARLLAEAPIVTLTGTGGVGKTRLAAQFGSAQASRFLGGAWFCSLSSATSDDDVIERLGAALGLRAASTHELARDVTDWLKFSHALLIVDNCEQVAARVSALLGNSLEGVDATRILFTSRRALRIPGERVMRVHPLRRPLRLVAGEVEDPRITLLVDRAQAAGAFVDTDDPSLIDIADRVEGLPLAIELAARRLTSMTPPELLTRLAHSFDLLDGAEGSPQERQALQATIDWSFGLLGGTSRLMFAAVSVCGGGFGLELAEAIGRALGLSDSAVAKAVADLWDQSLISTEGSVPGKARYRMLALIKEYSSKQLDLDGNRHVVARAHAEYFADLVARVSKCPYGPQEADAGATIEAEFGNIRRAIGWCIAEKRWDLVMRLLDSLVPELVLHGRIEIGRWATEALAALGDTEHPVRSVASALAANMALVEGRFKDAESLSAESLESEARVGGPAAWLSRNVLALLRAATQNFEEAEVFLGEMAELTAVSGDPMPVAVSLFDRALLASFSTNPAGGLGCAEELVSLGDAWGSASLRAMGLVSVGRALALDDVDRARTTLAEAMTLAEGSGCGLLVDQAKRVMSEIDVVVGVHGAGFRGFADLLQGFGHSGDLSQQLQTVVSALDPLVTFDACEVATTLCGALSQTALGSAAQCQRVLALSRTRLSSDAYRTAFERGSVLSPTQLVELAAEELDRLITQSS